jgi:hypothetical protein
MGIVTKTLAYQSDSVFESGSQRKVDRRQAKKIGSCVRFVLDQMKDVSNYVDSLDREERAKVQFVFNREKVVLLLEDDAQSFTVPQSLRPKYLKQLKKVVSFLECTGPLFKKSDETLEESATESVDKVKKGSKPTWAQNGMTGLTALDGVLSSIRQGVNIKEGPQNRVSAGLGFTSGLIWFTGALMDIIGGFNGSDYSEKIGDFEGKRRAQAQMVSGGFGAVGSGFFVGTKAEALGWVKASTATALSNVATAAFGVGSLIGMGTASLGIYRCYRFRQRLDSVMKDAGSEGMELRAALLFLKDALSIHPVEKLAIEEQVNVENPELEDLDKAQIVEEKLRGLAEAKVKYLKRRTSFKAVEQILSKTDQLLEGLDQIPADRKTIVEARDLIDLVKSENKEKIALFAWAFLASLLSFVASILFLAAVVGTAVIAAYCLMAVSTLILLVIILRGLYAKYCKEDKDSSNAEGALVHGQGSGK